MTTTKVYSVLTFDICSSTNILEDLLRTEHITRWKDLQVELKEFLRAEAISFPFILYKFTGDGWIILFESELDGDRLMKFIYRLVRKYRSLYSTLIKPELETHPPMAGITVGMDRGRLITVTLNGKTEYIGRAINVACRLQSSIRDRDRSPGNKLLISKTVYNLIKNDLTTDNFLEVKRKLRNIADDKEILCMKSSVDV